MENPREIQTYTREIIFFLFSAQVFYLRTRRYCEQRSCQLQNRPALRVVEKYHFAVLNPNNGNLYLQKFRAHFPPLIIRIIKY